MARSGPKRYKVGNLVKLLSGGPDMTVKKIGEDRGPWDGEYQCQWFAGKKLEAGWFPEDSLEPAKKNDKSEKPGG